MTGHEQEKTKEKKFVIIAYTGKKFGWNLLLKKTNRHKYSQNIDFETCKSESLKVYNFRFKVFVRKTRMSFFNVEIVIKKKKKIPIRQN